MTTNPKQLAAEADDKAKLDLLEHAADVEIAKVMAHGAAKYGRRNYCLSPIEARVYAAAIKRHIGAWLDGEDDAPDSGINHLAHIGANIHVLFAAMEAGTFVDDRAPDQAAHDEAHERLRRIMADDNAHDEMSAGADVPPTHMLAGADFGSSGRVIPIRRVDPAEDQDGRRVDPDGWAKPPWGPGDAA